MNEHFNSKQCLASVLMPAVLISLFALASFAPPVRGQDNQKREIQTSTTPIRELPPNKKRYALLIGVSRYTDRRISQLIGPENDVDMLAEALVKYAGFPRDNVVVLATNKPEEKQPEGYTILEYISTLAGLAGKDGLFLLSFSGHGYELDGQAFFLGSNARLTPDLKILQKTSVSWSDMTEILNDAGVGQLIMLLDACRNDPRSTKGMEQPNQITQIYERGLNVGKSQSSQRAFVKMLATQRGEPAYEDPSRNLGYFISAIVDGIKGEAADENGIVTLANLWRYVDEQVPNRARLRGTKQKPVVEMSAYDQEQVVLAVTPKKAKPEVAKVETPPDKPIENPVLTELNDWIKTRKSQKIGDYKEFLKNYPSGNFAEEASNRIRDIEEAANPKPVPAASSSPADPTIKPLATPTSPVESPATAMNATEDLMRLRRGDELVGQRLFAQAEKEYRKAISLNPNKAVYFGRLGVALYHQGRFKEAEDQYKKAISLDAYSGDLFFNLGLALYMRQKYADAEGAFRKALKLNPNDAACHVSMGLTLAFQEKLIEAELEFREGVKRDPDNAVYHNNLANVLLKQKKYIQAEAEYRTAIKLDPSNTSYKDNLNGLRSLRH